MDTLRQPVSSTFDLSDISHFLFYYIIGLIYPNHYKIIIIFALLWEIFEFILVQNDTLYHLTKTYSIVPEKYWNETLANKIVDLIMNLSGYYLGSNTRLS